MHAKGHSVRVDFRGALCLMIVVQCVALIPAAVAQASAMLPAEEIEPAPGPNFGPPPMMRRFFDQFKELGPWDQQFNYIMPAAEKFFIRNGWESEPDLFALEVVRAVESKPPWAVQERMTTIKTLISDRYALDAEQEQRLVETMQRGMGEIFRRNAPRIMSYGVEALTTRLSGEPFTPEQVARWMKLAEPVIQDARNTAQSLMNEFSEHLTEDQREMLLVDMEAAQRRSDRVMELGRKWANGEWSAEDWGLEEDPIQTGQLRAAGVPPHDAAHAPNSSDPTKDGSDAAPPMPPSPGNDPTGTGAASPSAEAAAGLSNAERLPRNRPRTPQPAQLDNDPWAVHTREFVQRYQLDDDQSQRAWQIYRESRERRDEYVKRHEARIAGARGAANGAADERTHGRIEELTARERAAIDRLFDQFKLRLEKLPTRAQRKAAGPAKSSAPDAAASARAPSTAPALASPVPTSGPALK